MSALLTIEDLRTTFPMAGGERVAVVDGVSLELERGEVLALVGESGSGKSMTALSVLRLVPRPGRIDGGRVLLEDRDLVHLPVPEIRAIRGRRIAMIFQEPMTSLNPVVRVGRQVEEAIRLHESVSRAAARSRSRELFERVGIPDAPARLDSYPHQLSGGLKQRVMIAMALATRPSILLADEPTTALDVTIQAQILSLLAELARDLEMAVLLITHDLGVVNELADRVAVMYAGRVVETGLRTDVLGHPAHPYTRGLLRALPGNARPGEELQEIPGTVPRPEAWPPGCRFAPRCVEVLPTCHVAEPRRLAVEGAPGARGHEASCHLLEPDRSPGPGPGPGPGPAPSEGTP